MLNALTDSLIASSALIVHCSPLPSLLPPPVTHMPPFVTEQPPGGHKHPITGKRKEGVWKGYLKLKGPASVKIVYGFDKEDEEFLADDPRRGSNAITPNFLSQDDEEGWG